MSSISRTRPNPGILGKLKIPGYSDYLHPYDQDHIIGVGKETESNEWGGVSTSGLKLALFDVSDVNHPSEVDHVEIGDAGSDSEALRDHKAFLFSKEKDLLVIPVREVQKVLLKGDYSPYTQKIWQGAYVFSVSPSKGFTLRGKVTHSSEDIARILLGIPGRGKEIALYRGCPVHPFVGRDHSDQSEGNEPSSGRYLSPSRDTEPILCSDGGVEKIHPLFLYFPVTRDSPAGSTVLTHGMFPIPTEFRKYSPFRPENR